MARENSGWGYDRIVGALANLGHVVSDQTVGNSRRYGTPHRSEARDNLEAVPCSAIWQFSLESTSSPWKSCTWRGLATYYVLFFLHLETRRVTLGGITRHPTEHGWSRLLAMLLMRFRHLRIFVTLCTIAIRSSAHRSGQRSQPAA